MVVRYTDFLADKRLESVDGQLTSSSAVSDARSTWEDVGHGHLKTDGITHDGERGDSISGRQLERGLCVIRPPKRTYVDCWSCVMNGDGCSDGGLPCQRCAIRSQRAQQHFLDCNRMKLEDFVMDFLPPSHTVMHQKQSIEDCVQKEVQAWDYTRPVEVLLTSGYGHSLLWVLHEFKPASAELLQQYQYLQDFNTGQSVRLEKWSPPLGITKFEPSDVWRLERYIDELMTDEHLLDLPWICFEEESQFDGFQATMLDMICKLYLATIDRDLKKLLHDLIRMIIITYIMGHTLTITAETLPAIHTHLKNRGKPAQLAPQTSPRLANRQLKFFFHVLRNQSYKEVLKWQQATLQMSQNKDSTWLAAFCVMLVLAMVLEEVQRTIQIQADAKAQKLERSSNEAQLEARNACERIDSHFALLIRLFQYKYRDNAWVPEGSFGPHTPLLRDPAGHEFCRDLRVLLVESEVHLRSRKDLTFSPENQCQYTSRSVGDFLIPFLNLSS